MLNEELVSPLARNSAMRSFSRRPSHATIVSYLALFAALGGTSYAAVTITGKQVKDGSLTGKDLKNSSVTGSDIKNGSLRAADFMSGQLPAGSAGPAGSPGPAGPAGSAGAQGDPGADGSALAAGQAFASDDLVGFVGNTNFGFTSVRRVSTGRYCVTLEPDLRTYVNILTVTVSAIKNAGSNSFTGSPIVRQDIPSVPPCDTLEIQIVTEVDNAGAIAPSNRVSFAMTAN